jgi:serine/threonine-protein kinase SRK2
VKEDDAEGVEEKGGEEEEEEEEEEDEYEKRVKEAQASGEVHVS